MYSSQTFQDLINQDTTNEEIQSVIDDLKALEEEVADNKLDISANTLAISVNSGLISTNSSSINTNSQNINSLSQNIQNNTVDISNNSTSINNNTTSINFNATTISNLNQEVLKKDGSIDLDIGYTPSNNQSVATKNYVDTHSTSASYLRVDGSNSMTGDLNLDSNDLKLNSVNSLSATGNNTELNVHSDFDLLTFGNSAMAVGQTQIHVNRLFRVVNNDIECSNLTTGNINGTNFNTLVSDVGTNTSDIIDLQNDKLNLSGGTMSGNLDMDQHAILDIGSLYTGQVQSLLDTQLSLWHYQSNGVNPNSSHQVITIVDKDNVNILADINMSAHNISNVGTIDGYDLDTDFIKPDGSIPMTANLNMGNHHFTNLQSLYTTGDITINNQSSYLRIDKMTPQLAGSNKIYIYGTNGLATRFIECNTVSTDLQCRSVLDMDNNNIINTGTINGYDLSTFNSSINTNTSNISTNTSNISTNTSNISTNTSNISTNTSDISTNTSSISINTTDIASNANAIPLKVSKSGDTMTGDLTLSGIGVDLNFIAPGVTSHIRPGVPALRIIDPNGVILSDTGLTQKYNFPMTTGTSTSCVLDNYVIVEEGLKVIGDYGPMMGSGGVVGANFYGRKQLWLKNTTSGGDAGWFIGNQGDSSTTGNDNDLYFQVQYYNGTQRLSAYIQDSTTNVRMNHTYSHRCMPTFEYTEDKIGLIVETTGRYMDLLSKDQECSQIDCIKINDALPMVRICNEEKSKKVFGVISNEEEKTRTWAAGNFVSLYDKVEGDNRVVVNGGGEGSIYVCNKNGNLENGDFICSAGINGYGMRQDLPYIANYTVGKITMDCDFNPQLEEVKIYKGYDEEKKEIIWEIKRDENGDIVYKPQYEMIELDDGLKVAFVGCVYFCS